MPSFFTWSSVGVKRARARARVVRSPLTTKRHSHRLHPQPRAESASGRAQGGQLPLGCRAVRGAAAREPGAAGRGAPATATRPAERVCTQRQPPLPPPATTATVIAAVIAPGPTYAGAVFGHARHSILRLRTDARHPSQRASSPSHSNIQPAWSRCLSPSFPGGLRGVALDPRVRWPLGLFFVPIAWAHADQAVSGLVL